MLFTIKWKTVLHPANILILFKQIASVGGKITAVSVEHLVMLKQTGPVLNRFQNPLT